MTRNLINHVPRPARLLLVWRPYEQVKERGHWAVAEVKPVAETHQPNEPLARKNHYNRTAPLALRYFMQDGPESEFHTLNGVLPNGEPRSLAQLHKLGYFGYPAFNYGEENHRNGVLEAFLRRVPPLYREDFDDYLLQYRLSPELKEKFRYEPYLMLARTGAITSNDHFRLIDPLENFSHGQVLLEVQGYRHKVDALTRAGKTLSLGETVMLRPDSDNPHDPNAVKITVLAGNGAEENSQDQIIIGHICRFQSAALRRLLLEEQQGACHIKAQITRLNGRPECPKAYILLMVEKAGL